MSKQDCRKLDKVKQKPRFYGFRSAAPTGASSSSASSQGGAQGSATAAAAVHGMPRNRQPQGSVSGLPATPPDVVARATGNHMNVAPGQPGP
eukprot:2636149-Amphidinium_carterae.1